MNIASKISVANFSLSDRLKNLLFKVPLRFKIMGLAAGLVALSGTVTILKVNTILISNMKTLLREKSVDVARELSSHSKEYILINDLYGLTRLFKDAVKNRPEVRYAFVVDSNSNVLAHSFADGFPSELIGDKNRLGFQDRTVPLITNEGIVWDTFYPILEGDVGGLRVGITESIMRQQTSALLRSLFIHTILVIFIALVFSMMLTYIITKPVKKLLEATHALRKGKYDYVNDKITQDEVGDLIVAFNAMTHQLEQADLDRRDKEKMRSEFLQRIISTQEEERKRVARELHDQTGQALASIMVRLNVLGKGDKTELADSVASLKNALIEEMGVLHNLALELRPSVLDDMGLVPGLELYINQLQNRHDLHVEFVKISMEDKRADNCVETCIYRIIQEALINVVKHADADTVKILLELRLGKIRGIIEDNGTGFDMAKIPRERLGIYGMEERASLLDGTLKVDSEPGQGTMVSFTIPLEGKLESHE